MQPQKFRFKPFSWNRKRIAFLGFLVLALITMILVGNAIVTKNTLPNILFIFLSTLGTIFAFGQWIVPLPPIQNTKVELTTKLPKSVPAPTIRSISHESQLFANIEKDIQFSMNGALIVYVSEDLVGKAIKLSKLEDDVPYSRQKTFTVYVRQEITEDGIVNVAVFPRIREGNYNVLIPSMGVREVSIFSSLIMKLDVRGEVLYNHLLF